MVNYRCIGKGVTDSNGVAHMTYSSSDNGVTFTQLANNGYLGTGKGKVDVVASFDNPLNESSIVSEPSSVWDTLFFDDGVSGTANWNNYQSRLNVTTDSTGTTITRNSTGSYSGYYIAKNGETFNSPVIIEMQLLDYSTTSQMGFNFETSSDNLCSFGDLNIPKNCHLKLIYEGTTVKAYIDGSTTPVGEYSLFALSDFKIGFYIRNTNTYIKFKELKIYNG